MKKKTAKLQGKWKNIVIYYKILTKCGQTPLFMSLSVSTLHKVICYKFCLAGSGSAYFKLKSGAQDMVRTAKADLKRKEKEMKGRAAQRRLDRKAATLSKLQREAAEAQRDQNSEKLEELSTLMNDESKDLADQVEELEEVHVKLADQAEEMRLQAASSAYKAAKQAQRIRLSKEG